MNKTKYPPTKHIIATGLPDAYTKLIKTCLTEGAIKRRFYGKLINTLDIISLTEINHPMLEPMLHSDFPTKELHLKEYEKQWERDYDWIKQGFEYNYMNRLISYPISHENTAYTHDSYLDDYYRQSPYVPTIDQLKVIRESIAKRIEKSGECLVSNRDQVITWIPDRDMFVNEDQPCMQRLQFFVYEYPKEIENLVATKNYYGNIEYENDIIMGKAEFHVSWRSRDLFGAWNSNMIALINMLKKEIFDPNNLELIRVVDFCNSLHIYEGDWKQAELVKPVAINPMLLNR